MNTLAPTNRDAAEPAAPRKALRALTVTAGVAIFALAGCETTNPYTGTPQTSRTAIGAGVGAVAGALLGAATNTSNSDQARKNALIGAGVGALVGGAIIWTASRPNSPRNCAAPACR